MFMKKIQEVAKYLIVPAVLMAVFAVPTMSRAQYYPNLQVSCSPSVSYTQTNNPVRWSASATGGNGYYSYYWFGTDNISGNANSILSTYTTAGTKTASVTVTSSDGQIATVNCGNTTIYQLQNNYTYYYPVTDTYAPLNGSCSASVNNTQTGSIVTWSSNISGGNGVYSYYWKDNDNNVYTGGASFAKNYTTSGTKYMNVTFTSNGQAITKQCSAYVKYGTPIISSTYQSQNQVLDYTSANTNTSSVYLSDVPYTGFDDVARIVLFISMLILWSAMLAYMFLKKKIGGKVFVAENISEGSEIIKTKINTEEAELKNIEDYARMQKILLSEDASIKIFKLSKLGKINASEIIKKMSGVDWIAVGESDLEKYI
jgi:hypothetical protein